MPNRNSVFAFAGDQVIFSSPYKPGQESQRQATANRNSKCVKYTMNVSYVNTSGPMLNLRRSIVSKFIPIKRAHITILLKLNTNKEHPSEEDTHTSRMTATDTRLV